MPHRITLISPKSPLYRHRGGSFFRTLRYCPLTLPTLASLVPPEIEAKVALIDEGVADVPDDLDADLIGLTVITGNAPRAYELAGRFRARGIPVVLGGPHVTLVPEDALPHADAVVVGYAEQAWPRLLRDFAAGAMRPRYDQGPDFTLEGLPPVRRDLLPRRRYLTTNVFEATRGCVYDCEFCVVPTAWGKKPYQKPIPDVIEDIRRTGARRAIFVDLNLTADRDYAACLFEALIPLRLQWYGLATGHIASDPTLLDLCARSGCRGLLVGFESLSEANMTALRKGFHTPTRYRGMVDTFHRAGIAVQACFVFGLDRDTPDVFRRTAEFVVEARVDLPRFAIATPFPGTPFYQRLEGEDRILTRNWELYDAQHVVFQPTHMTPAELQRGTEAAWRHAYSYRSLARRIRGSAAPFPVALAANLGYRFYAHRLNRFYHCDQPIGRDWRPRAPAPAAPETSSGPACG
jgi:radical SAM superfamily enzyme YgiQ (UPF0313 family)